MKGDELDPKGLILEAYRIDGIGAEECRSIFLDWALSMPTGTDMGPTLTALLDRHGVDGHPMTAVLREGLQQPSAPRRRGGRQGRVQ